MQQSATLTTKAVIYCRVSSLKQVNEGHGLSSQETRCREYAKHKGYDIVQVFHEEGITGKLLERVQMQAMLHFLRQHKRQGRHVVIIDDISRLARDVETHIHLRTAISEAGGKLESPSIEFGEDSDSRLVEHLLASVAAHQREKNAEQVRNRMRARAMNGYWVSNPPIGYKYEKQSGHGKILVRDEPVASVMQEAMQGFASGRFQTQAEVKYFLESKVDFPKGKNGQVHLQRVADMLSRPIYAGRIHMPVWDIHNQPGQHEGLISYEDFQKIQHRLKGHAYAPARQDLNKDFPLRGFISCGGCGKPMTSGWSKGRSKHYAYYYCQQKGCTHYGKSIKRDTVEQAFEELLKKMRPTEDLLKVMYSMFRDHWDNRLHQIGSEAESIEKAMEKVDGQVQQLLDRIMASENDTVIAAYEKRITELQDSKIVLQEKIANCGRIIPDFEVSFRTAFEFLGNPHNL
ncbi:MAG: recombinase family protein [Pseudomonadota bacterium]